MRCQIVMDFPLIKSYVTSSFSSLSKQGHQHQRNIWAFSSFFKQETCIFFIFPRKVRREDLKCIFELQFKKLKVRKMDWGTLFLPISHFWGWCISLTLIHFQQFSTSPEMGNLRNKFGTFLTSNLTKVSLKLWRYNH